MSDQPKPAKSNAKLPPFSKEYLANEHDAKHFGEPKPTGEWTVEHGKLHDTIVMGDLRVELSLAFDESEKIAEAHKAAIAKERDYGNRITVQLEEAQQQLDAEREKVQTLGDALKCVRKILGPHMKKHWINGLTIIDAELAKVGK